MTSSLGTGLGLKPPYYSQALACTEPGLWFEVHPENYFAEGGPRLQWLEAIRAIHPLSLHGVGLSLAADAALDPVHLRWLTALNKRMQPELVSEHLAWSTIDGHYLPDLLPFPRTSAALSRIVEHIDCVQQALGRVIALENPAHYVSISAHDWDEIDFLSEIARRAGCHLLLDINNVFVSAHNLGFSAAAYLAQFPEALIAEIHLAGHACDGQAPNDLLIDSHDAPVASPVWDLYRSLIMRIGARPTLIERDDKLPPWSVLLAERNIAQSVLDACGAAEE